MLKNIIKLVISLITGRRSIVFRLDTGHSHYTPTTLDIAKHLPVTTLQLFRLKMDGTLAHMKDTKDQSALSVATRSTTNLTTKLPTELNAKIRCGFQPVDQKALSQEKPTQR